MLGLDLGDEKAHDEVGEHRRSQHHLAAAHAMSTQTIEHANTSTVRRRVLLRSHIQEHATSVRYETTHDPTIQDSVAVSCRGLEIVFILP